MRGSAEEPALVHSTVLRVTTPTENPAVPAHPHSSMPPSSSERLQRRIEALERENAPIAAIDAKRGSGIGYGPITPPFNFPLAMDTPYVLEQQAILRPGLARRHEAKWARDAILVDDPTTEITRSRRRPAGRVAPREGLLAR